MDDLIALWTRQPFTAVYVTHNLAEAVRLGHRIVVLSRRPGADPRDGRDRQRRWPSARYGDPDLEAHAEASVGA